MPDVSTAPASPAATPTPSAPPSNGSSSATQAPASGVASAPKQPAQAATNGAKPPQQGETAKAKPPPGFELTPDGKLRLKGLKVDGVEEDAEYTEEELRREFQERRAGQKRLQEAAKEKQRLQQAIAMLKQDPIAAMASLGVDTEQAMSAHLAKQAQLAAMSEEQRQVLAARQQAAQYQRQVKAYEAQMTEHATQQQWENQWKPELEAAFKEVGWADGAEGNLLAVAQMAEMYEKAGIELGPRELVKLVDAENGKQALNWVSRASPQNALATVKAAIGRLGVEQGEELLAIPQLKAIMEARVAAIKAARNPAAQPPTGQPPRQEAPRREFLTPEELRSRMMGKR